MRVFFDVLQLSGVYSIIVVCSSVTDVLWLTVKAYGKISSVSKI